MNSRLICAFDPDYAYLEGFLFLIEMRQTDGERWSLTEVWFKKLLTLLFATKKNGDEQLMTLGTAVNSYGWVVRIPTTRCRFVCHCQGIICDSNCFRRITVIATVALDAFRPILKILTVSIYHWKSKIFFHQSKLFSFNNKYQNEMMSVLAISIFNLPQQGNVADYLSVTDWVQWMREFLYPSIFFQTIFSLLSQKLHWIIFLVW